MKFAHLADTHLGRQKDGKLRIVEKQIFEKIDQNILDQALNLAKQGCPKWLYDEVEEDLNELANSLQKLGVIVHRPRPFDLSAVYSTPYWYSNSN